MHKYDEFTHNQLMPLLEPGEGIELTGFLFTQTVSGVIASRGLSLLGGGYFLYGCLGLRDGSGKSWARRLFGFSILYLVVLFAALVIDP